MKSESSILFLEVSIKLEKFINVIKLPLKLIMPEICSGKLGILVISIFLAFIIFSIKFMAIQNFVEFEEKITYLE